MSTDQRISAADLLGDLRDGPVPDEQASLAALQIFATWLFCVSAELHRDQAIQVVDWLYNKIREELKRHD